MPKLKLNVASNPFVNARHWSLLLIFGALVGGALTYANVRDLTTAWLRQSQLERALIDNQLALAQIEEATRRTEDALSVRQRLEISEVGTFATNLIRSRALSWTQLFNDLERVLPRDVRVVSINPSVTGEVVRLKMECTAKDDESKLEFFSNLYTPPFDDPVLLSEQVTDKQISFDITCVYRPGAGRS